VWLSPVQARILPISDRQQAYAEELLAKLREKGLRCEIDSRNEKIGYKIRSAQVEKIPYMLVIGDKEQEAGEISLRSRKDGDLGSMPAQAVIEKLDKENKDKVN
jgi:threonyl-tRNA synthetase